MDIGQPATAIVIEPFSEDYDRRMKHAHDVAQWHLGDATWASMFVGAFLWPDPEALAAEINEEERLVDENRMA